MLFSLPRVRSVVEISYGCIGRSDKQPRTAKASGFDTRRRVIPSSRSNTRNRVFGDRTRFVKAVNVAPVDTVVGVRRSLWRATVVYRICSAAFSVYLIARWLHLYQPERQWLGVLVGVAIVAVTSVVAVVGLTGRANRVGF